MQEFFECYTFIYYVSDIDFPKIGVLYDSEDDEDLD